MPKPTLTTLPAELARDQRGVAAVEMGLVSGLVLIPLLGGLAGFGQGLAMQIQLDRALHAALFTAYGTASTLTSESSSSVTSDMTTAVQNGYGSTAPAVSANVAYYCISPTSTRSGTGASTAPTCSNGQVTAAYLTVNASTSFTPLVNVGITGWNEAGGTGGSVTISSTATIRIQ